MTEEFKKQSLVLSDEAKARKQNEIQGNYANKLSSFRIIEINFRKRIE